MPMSYHTNEELVTAAHELSARVGARAVVEPIGETVQGRPIPVVRISHPGRRPDADRPQALLTANIHGNEVISSELALRVIELLTAPSPGGLAQALLSLGDVTVIPAINLDSRAPAAAALTGGAGSASRRNAAGVDLNRNFPRPRDARDSWHPLAGTDRRWLPWYRGPKALSEPEARAVADLAERLRPRAAINAHSVGRLFLYPYCYKAEAPPDLDAFLAMGAAFVGAQPHAPYEIKQSRSWYTVLGDLDDWLYDRFGTLSVTIELARPLAGVEWNPWRLVAHPVSWMNPRDPAREVDNTAEACLQALATALRARS